ncbi:phosphotransferase family protein [Nonomuraea jabiensis]|uniref:Aminoglycoside phosphotransferase (APT) family kinase protein n=1 Tax=Nonomuraea jabiensis TaxID=882448 RepID=A0A7W9G0I3_9ACTN|nr:phosphotransferase [Nonomuraea jabiensis]MBB5774979.1 aminoglycoside phosphotransferase (APT) family kinase protein [Nonomuraea jabiensis]
MTRSPSEAMLASGRRVTDLTPLPAGRSHQVYSGVDAQRGNRVVIKLDDSGSGRLDNEYEALRLLAGHAAPVPAVLDKTTWQGRTCLVLSHVDGSPSRTAGAYFRLGNALASLATVPAPGDGLRTSPGETIETEHRRRVRNLALYLGETGPILAAVTVPRAHHVVTHGDPGPENYLDRPADGTLVDFESAMIAPFGLDLGRALFATALVEGAGAAQANAALLDGYRTAHALPRRPDLDAWVAIGGTQILAWRVAMSHRPATPPWQAAAEALKRHLLGRDCRADRGLRP